MSSANHLPTAAAPGLPGNGSCLRQDCEEAARRRALADSVTNWWHSVDLGYGVVTQGHKSIDQIHHEIAAFQFPDLGGKTFLDIGAWDGAFSFEAERRGARRVVALDHYVWSIDL